MSVGFSLEFLPVGQVGRGGSWEGVWQAVLASSHLLTFTHSPWHSLPPIFQAVSFPSTSQLLSSFKVDLGCACAER